MSKCSMCARASNQCMCGRGASSQCSHCEELQEALERSAEQQATQEQELVELRQALAGAQRDVQFEREARAREAEREREAARERGAEKEKEAARRQALEREAANASQALAQREVAHARRETELADQLAAAQARIAALEREAEASVSNSDEVSMLRAQLAQAEETARLVEEWRLELVAEQEKTSRTERELREEVEATRFGRFRHRVELGLLAGELQETEASLQSSSTAALALGSKVRPRTSSAPLSHRRSPPRAC